MVYYESDWSPRMEWVKYSKLNVVLGSLDILFLLVCSSGLILGFLITTATKLSICSICINEIAIALTSCADFSFFSQDICFKIYFEQFIVETWDVVFQNKLQSVNISIRIIDLNQIYFMPSYYHRFECSNYFCTFRI